MNLKKDERTCLFIDGSSLYSTSRSLGFDVDYKKLLDFFASKTHVIRAYYYAAILDTEDYSPLKPLTDWLSYNGYFLVTKPAREFTDATGKRRVKGNMEIEIAIDMMEMAPHIDHAILFTGDSDFRRVVEAVQRQGTRVSVVSSMRSSPPLIGDDLRRQADNFLELATLGANFTRRQTETPTRTRTAPPPVRHPADQLSEPEEEDPLT
ncbi:LabA-like NYN domain-containing protein [Acetobacter senegalensis]|uniref:LabA-like NYN domain-containing protein n=1 Tax=Acetobacter senegalensis TaxID=446692 RepID=UPI0026516B1A|nr:NYN domain-containing protein [Acetobacter senegalensis]MDN7352410.1 NYN domain-containing protein [Acetobacter senegalensis]